MLATSASRRWRPLDEEQEVWSASARRSSRRWSEGAPRRPRARRDPRLHARTTARSSTTSRACSTAGSPHQQDLLIDLEAWQAGDVPIRVPLQRIEQLIDEEVLEPDVLITYDHMYGGYPNEIGMMTQSDLAVM